MKYSLYTNKSTDAVWSGLYIELFFLFCTKNVYIKEVKHIEIQKVKLKKKIISYFKN